jgi:hypothetical protein
MRRIGTPASASEEAMRHHYLPRSRIGGFTKTQFEAAMRRLLLVGKIKIEDRGFPSHPMRTFIYSTEEVKT